MPVGRSVQRSPAGYGAASWNPSTWEWGDNPATWAFVPQTVPVAPPAQGAAIDVPPTFIDVTNAGAPINAGTYDPQIVPVEQRVVPVPGVQGTYTSAPSFALEQAVARDEAARAARQQKMQQAAVGALGLTVLGTGVWMMWRAAT